MKKISLFFYVLIIIPYILHGYSENLAILYWNHVIILVIIILFYFINKGAKLKFDLEAKLYLFFILTIILPILLFKVNYLRDFIKYLSYILIYLLVFRNYLNYKIYYKIFISIIVVYLLFSFPIYFFDIVLGSNFYQHYPINSLLLPSTLKIVSRPDYSYYFPFYLYLVPTIFRTTGELNFLGFPRFFGFSYEPTTLSMIVLPLIYISIDLKKYKSAIILSIFIFIISSYFAIFLWFILILFYFSEYFKKFKYIYIVVLVFLIISYLSFLYNYFILFPILHNRMISYQTKLYQHFSSYLIASKRISDVPEATSALFYNSFRYGLLMVFSYLAIIFFYIKKIVKLKNLSLLIVFLSVILYSQKAPYFFAPLIFFYINYLNINENT